MFTLNPTLKPFKQIHLSGSFLLPASPSITVQLAVFTRRQPVRRAISQSSISYLPNSFPVTIQARPNGQGGDDSIQQYRLNNQLKSKLAVKGAF